MAQDQPHSEEFQCTLCSESFDSPEALEAHKKLHFRPAETHDKSSQDIRGDIGAAGLPTSANP